MALDPVLSAIVVICLLLVVAKVLSELFTKIGLPGVIGEVLAGVILGPFALGTITYEGQPLITLGPLTNVFAYFGTIIVLFTAGLETTFAEFRAAGIGSFVVAIGGTAVPFAAGFLVSSLLGLPSEAGLIVGLALIQSSVAIIIRILEELHMMGLKDSKMIVNVAVVDDALSLSILTIVISVVVAQVPMTFVRVGAIFARSLVLWFALVAGLAFVIPRVVKRVKVLEKEGMMETVATVTCFGAAALSVFIGLSPLVGAFAAGMGLAGSKAIKRVKGYIEKISLIFVPVLFASMGAQMNLGAFFSTTLVLLIVIIFLAVEIVTKLVGSGLPAMLFLKDKAAGMRVGLAMACVGMEGMLILNIGLSNNMINSDVYTGLMLVSILTTIITPLALKPLYKRASAKQPEQNQER
jgi:Kef-type K+ transport system membrane component KefB